MKRGYYLLVVLSLLFACNSDDNNNNNNNSYTPNIGLVTGINARSSEFGPSIKLGNPNEYVDQMLFYPNPVVSALTVKDLTNTGIVDVWFIQANAEKIYQTTSFNSILNASTYTEGEIEASFVLGFNDYDGETSEYVFNVAFLTEGYYKVFVKRATGDLQWQNIYVGNQMDITSLTNFWNN